MTRSNRVTDEQVAAAQLRVFLDEKRGRTTPELVRKIANSLPGDEVVGVMPGEPAGPSPSPSPAPDLTETHEILRQFIVQSEKIRHELASGSYGRHTPIRDVHDVDVAHLNRQLLWLPHQVNEMSKQDMKEAFEKALELIERVD
ncbi:hypothetical protein ACIOD2_47340 [Amycolatopsis sp. NPDC088138]|uniref:hypothetical protein n=1 Tax=Amycolatopsis sp. NPDC088138 TaxID=3363938 RepID=UPI0038300439